MFSYSKYLILLIVGISISCNANKNTQSSYENDMHLLNNVWQLETWTKGGNERSVRTQSQIEILFDPNLKRIQGNDGCNQFNGNYSITDDILMVSDLGSTKMYCGKASANMEKTFALILSNCKIESLTDKELILANEENSLKFIIKK